MPLVERAPASSSLIDVLDRVLDKGIVIDAWVRVSLVGIDLLTVEARVVVASIDTYLRHADAMRAIPPLAQARGLDGAPREDILSEFFLPVRDGARLRPPQSEPPLG